MYKNFDEFKADTANKIIKAVKVCGDNNVCIVNKKGNAIPIVSSIHIQDKMEFNGEGEIIYKIECKSYGDPGYENADDFVEADVDYCYIDSVVDELERLFLYYNTNPLYNMLTLQEASLVWQRDSSTLRRVLMGPQFTEGVDFRKSEKPWLITKEAMERVYGKPKF